MTDSPQRSTEDRLDEIESRFAIADLVARYCEGTDTPDVEVFMSVWHDDAVSLLPDGKQLRGSAAIRASRDPGGSTVTTGCRTTPCASSRTTVPSGGPMPSP
jgi:SnoaL-like domain